MAGATAWPVIAEHTELLVAFGGRPRRTPRWPRAASAATPWPRRWRPPWRADAGWSRSARCAATPTQPGRRVERSGARHRRGVDARAGPHPRRRGAGRPRLPRAVHRRLPAVRGLRARRHRRRAEDAGVGGRDDRDRGGAIRALARRMAAGRTLVTVTWSLQRAEHGEQPVWMGIVLAAMLGQIGLPGGGFGHGYGSTATSATPAALSAPRLPQGAQRHRHLHPGGPDRRHAAASRRRLRLQRAAPPLPRRQARLLVRRQPVPPPPGPRPAARGVARPQTVVVHDPYWTAMARHADIVLPSTMSLERDDIGAGSGDSTLFAMPQLPNRTRRRATTTPSSRPWRTGCRSARASPRAERRVQWLRHLYEQWRRT